MKTKTLFFCLLCAGAVMLASCSKDDDITDPEEEVVNPEEEEETPEVPEDPGDSGDEDLNENTQEVNYDNAVTIAFASGLAAVDNPFADTGVTIENTDGHVVIRSSVTTAELTYVLSGTIDDGSVKIYGEAPFALALNGVGITNPAGAAINIQNKEKATVILVDETNNRLIDGATYVATDGEDMKSTFFSEGDLEFTGGGTLEIRGLYKHALCTDGSLTIAGGTINIKEAASDGIHTNDGVSITGGQLISRSVGDGIDCESKTEPISITGGEVSITTTGEKGHGLKAKHNVEIDTDGTVEVAVYGAASKAIKPTGDAIILSGDITVYTAGDAIWEEDEQDTSSAAGVKCDGNFLMEGGLLTIVSSGSGGKGISADGTLTINDGTVTVTTTGDQYVYDRDNDTAAKAIKSDGNLWINGGTIKIRTSKTEAEGLESKATLTITGGDIDIRAYDDAINATTHIQIDGGNIFCSSTVNDAIDSNGTLSITGGVVIAAGATQPEGGIDCDNSRFTITGGTVIGIGGSTSSPTANYCTQRSVVFTTNTSNVQVIRIEATSGGTEALTFKLPKTYSSSLTMLFSSASLAAGTGYTIYTGGSITGETNVHGLYTGATYTKGTSAGTFTTGSAAGSVSTVGNSSGSR